jgi:putative inorganic carbon (HCO3(-)) transporter
VNGTAAAVAPHPQAPRVSPQRARSPYVGFWNASWIVSATALVFIMIRASEFLGPLQRLKPVLAVTLLLLFMHISKSGRAAWQFVWSNVTFRLAVAYTACIGLSVPFSIWRGQSVETMMTVPWALILVMLLCLNTPRIKAFDSVLQLAVWIAALVGLALAVQGEVVEGSRMTSRGSYDPNDLGALFVTMFLFAIGASTRGTVTARLVSVLSSVVLLTVMMKTGSRGALIGLAVGLLVFILGYRPRKLMTILVAIVILGPLSWPLVPPLTRERAASLFALEDDYNTTSNSGRVYLWKRGVVFALKNPLVGIGAGTFEVQVGQDFREQGTRGAWHTAHNTYVQVFAELGMAGGMLLLAILGRGARNAATLWHWKKQTHRPELLASLAAYCTAITFLSHGYSYILWGMIGISAMTEQLLRTSVFGATSASGTPRAQREFRNVHSRSGLSAAGTSRSMSRPYRER